MAGVVRREGGVGFGGGGGCGGGGRCACTGRGAAGQDAVDGGQRQEVRTLARGISTFWWQGEI